MEKMRSYLIPGVVFSFLLVSALMLVGKSIKQREVVVFDKGRVVTEFAQTLESYQGNEAQKKILIKKFSAAIPKGLARFAKKKGAIILPARTDVIGARDVTDAVSESIAYCMKKDCTHA